MPGREQPPLKAAEQVAERIRRAIALGRVAPGDRLPPEAELVERLAVSRPTVREALRILEAQRLVSIGRGERRGAIVCAPSVAAAARYVGSLLQIQRSSLHDVFAARSVIECAAVGELARAITAGGGEGDRVRSALTQLAALAERQSLPQPPEHYVEHASRFHVAVVEMAGNQAVTILYRLLRGISDRHARTPAAGAAGHPRTATRFARSQSVHVDVLDLIGRGDDASAVDLWRRHNRASWRGLERLGIAGDLDVYS